MPRDRGTAVHEDNTPQDIDDTIADADLILRTRSGDARAFGELWRRHYPSGIAVARAVTSSIDADDLVQEAYTRIYQAIIKGGGPNGSFRAYLFTSIRNTAAAWGRSRREDAVDELDSVAHPDSTEQASSDALDRSLTAQAFRSLPTRWQEVLWYTEIEQMRPQEVAPLLGMKAGAVSQLAFRAREGLREGWIQAHLRSAEAGSECQWTIEHLGAYSRGNLGTRDHRRIETHLDECARCMIVAAEAKDVSKRLALVLLPLVLGVTGATGYLAALQGGGAPIVALAAMPSGVTNGVVVNDGGSGGLAAGTATSGTGGAAGAGASGGSGAAGGAAGSGAGGLLSGMGALVGAGSAALVVAGVVAAATIIPGLTGTDATTSLPSAGDSDSSSISSNLEADDSLLAESSDDETAVPDEDADDEKDAEKDAEESTPEQSAPEADTPTRDGLSPVSGPLTPPSGSTPAAPTQPGGETPGGENPGGETPGGETPGGETPGGENPGGENPGGEDDPGEENPGGELPPAVPSIVSTSVSCVPWAGIDLSIGYTNYIVQFTGAPGTIVQPYLGNSTARTEAAEIGADGVGWARLYGELSVLAEHDEDVTFVFTIEGVENPPTAAVRLTALPGRTGEPCGLVGGEPLIDLPVDEVPVSGDEPAVVEELAAEVSFGTPPTAPAPAAPVEVVPVAPVEETTPVEVTPLAPPAPAEQPAPVENDARVDAVPQESTAEALVVAE